MIDMSFPFEDFRNDVENALKDVGKKYDFIIETKNIKYNEFSIKLNVEFTDKVDGSDDAYKVEWNARCKRFGLKPEDFGKIVVVDGDRYEICGIHPNASRYPIVAKRLRDDKKYKFPLFMIKDALDNANKE